MKRSANYVEFKDLKEVRLPERSEPEPSPQLQPASRRIGGNRLKEAVVNSEHIKYKPIDRVAARVVAPAIWYNQPPQPEAKFMRAQDFGEPARIKTKNMRVEEGHVETVMETEGVMAISGDLHAKDVRESVKKTEGLVDRVQEALQTIQYLTSEIKGPWEEYEVFMKNALKEVREQRIALGTETRLLMAALKEVRQFFLEESYETQIQRLHEFIDLCERLKALKESGFLDAVSDTMLKL